MVRDFSGTWKVATAIMAIFVVTATFTVAFSGDDSTDESISSDNGKTIIDLSIKDNRTGAFAYSTSAPSFTTQFPSKSNDTFLCKVITELGNISYSLSDIKPATGNKFNRSNVKGLKDDCSISYNDLVENKLDVEFKVGLNGIKETLVLRERINTSHDLEIRTSLVFDDVDFSAWAGKKKVGILPIYTKGSIKIRNEDNDTVFTIPPAFAYDSRNGNRTSTPDIEEFSISNGTSRCLYKVSVIPAGIQLGVVVPSKLLNAKTTKYPVYIDPTLLPEISDETSYSNDDVYVYSNVDILSTGSLSLTNCNLIFGNGPFTLRVQDDGVLGLVDTDIYHENSGEPYYINVEGQLTIDGGSMDQPAEGLVISTNDNVEIKDFSIFSSMGDGITIDSTVGTVYINTTQIFESSGSGIDIASTSETVSIIGCDLNGGSSGITIFDSEVTIVETDFDTNTMYGVEIEGSSSDVYIIHSDFIDNGVAISSFDSTVTLNLCTITGGTTGITSTSSTLDIQECEISTNEYGISSSQSTISISGGMITGSDTGISSLQDNINFSGLNLIDLEDAGSISQPSHLDLQGMGISFCDSPLQLTSVGQGYISNSFVADNEDGIDVTGSTLSIWNTNFLRNNGTGLVSTTSTMTVTQCTFDGNDEGANCTYPSERFEFISCTFRNNQVGAHLSDGEFLLDNPTFVNNSNWNAVANSATMKIIAKYFPDWKYKRDQSITERIMELNLTLANENGTAKDKVTFTIYDADGQIANDVNGVGYLNVENSAEGEWKRIQLCQYIEYPNGLRDFKSPHTIVLVNETQTSGPYTAKIVMDAYKDLTLTWNYTVSDLDDDGVPDQDSSLDAKHSEPRDNVTWFEAEHHNTSNSIPQSELTAFEGTAINGTVLLQPNSFAEFPEGYYHVILRARGVTEGARMELVVQDGDGIEILGPQDFILRREAYHWFVSEVLHLDDDGVLDIYVNSSAVGQVLLDKLAVVRVKDASGTATAELPGHITDPLEVDSDDDLANDSVERSPSSSWLEVEYLTSNPRHEDINASSSTAVAHENGSRLILECNISKPRYTIDGQEKVRFYLKARKNVSASAQLMINVTYNGTTYSTTHSLVDRYDWYDSDEITLIDGVDTLTIRVYDLNDTNLADSADFVLIDKLHIRDPDTDPVPTFYASDPMDYDTDSDSLSDGYEIFGLFKVDKIEAEDCFLGEGVVVRDGLIFLNKTNSTDGNFFSFPFNMSEPGIYSIHVDYGISVPYGGKNLPLVGKMLRLRVANISNPEQHLSSMVEFNTSISATELYPNGGLGNTLEDLFSSKDFHFNLTNGSFDFYFDINPLVTLWGSDFSVWVDSIVIMRRTLAPLDSDADDDDAWDGLEFEGNSFPLNVDSDHDTIWDGEEYFTGADGWVTSPISNDTDADGILDQVEINSVLDLDPTDMDTDGDELPDGWIDGWLYHPEEGRYIINELLKDGYRQPWEGEDLDGSGINSTGLFTTDSNKESTGGETNPTDPDTDDDGLPDGWELRYRGQRDESGYPCMLNPLHNDSWLDADSDGLNNSQEHSFDTNPFLDDTDLDGIDDGMETKVGLRTNITDGMVSSNNYSEANGDDWIVYNPNPYITSQADVYTYSHNTTNFTIQDRVFNTGLEEGDPALLLEGNLDYSSHATGAVFNISNQGDLWWTEGVYPIYGNNILRFNGTDSSNSSDSHISLKVYDFGTPVTITDDMHLSFWMYVKASPWSQGHVGLDGRITNGYLSDPTNSITGLNGEALNVTNRSIIHGIWILFDYNLSSVAGQDLSYICVVYDDGNISEKGVFRAYFDNIRVYKEATPPYDQWLDDVLHLHGMNDGSSVIYNSTLDRIYVLANETEVVDKNDDGVLSGPVYVFTFEGTPDASIRRGRAPDIRFKGREALGDIDPFSKDSDGDGITDGMDGALNGSGHDWWDDIDGDGLVSALDIDSDNDTILDSIEDLDRDGVFDPLDNETVPYLADTDNDGTPDNLDPLPLDFDNDGLTGFLVHDGYAFYTGSLEAKWGTTINNPDSDGDGLLDGDEDANRDGEYDPINETHPMDLDSDDDGLWDGYNNLSTQSTSWEFIKIEAEDFSLSNRNCTITNGTASNGEMVEFWTDDFYEYSIEVSGTPSGTQLKIGTYEIMAWVQDNCTEDNIADHNPKNISLYLDGTAMDETLVHVMPYYMFDAPNGTWSFIYIGMVNLTTAQTYTIRIENGWRDVGSDGEKFFLDYLNLTRVKYFGEVRIGTDPTSNDTDDDHVQDGTEWGLINHPLSIKTDTYAQELGTNTTFFVPDSDTANITNPLDPDTDGDGLYDGWCDINGSGDLDENDIGEDINCNGAIDVNETDPLDADTDDDGLSDLFEVTYGTSPLNRDSDGDNVSDGTELGVDQPLPDTDIYATTNGFYHFKADQDQNTTTNPLINDTDEDGLPDGWIDYNEDGEFNWSEGEDFNLSGRHNDSGVIDQFYNSTGWFYESNPLTNDSDSDMLSDSDELNLSCDPNNPDTDNDTLLDGWEVYIYGTCPTSNDTDNDTLLDHFEIQNGSNPNCTDSDNDGLPDGLEVNWSDDSDLDGYINAMDPDSDNDGLWDVDEETNTTTARQFVPTTNGLGDASNMTNPDTDGDGINDTFDVYPLDFDNDKLSGFIDFGGEETARGTNYTRADTDYDGLSDWAEIYTHGTNATVNDTDGDGLLDGVEVRGWYIYFLDEYSNVSHYKHVTSNATLYHTDGDGMNDAQEFMVSDPNSNDTDGDGLNDPFDPDNSTIEREPPEINNITLRINITKESWGILTLRHYYLQVIVNATDNAGIRWVNVTFLDSDVTVTCTNWSEDGSIYYAQFTSSKDQLADGFKVEVSVTDVNNYTVFQVKEGDFETGWEKLWETLTEWISAAVTYIREVAAAFLTMLLGPIIAGSYQGFLEGFLMGLVDDLTFIYQVVDMILHMNEMAEGILLLIENPMMVFQEMINATLLSAARICPYYDVDLDLGEVYYVLGCFFTFNWGISASDIVLWLAAYIVSYIIGFIFQQIFFGGNQILSKIGKLLKGARLANKASGGIKAVDSIQDATKGLENAEDVGKGAKNVGRHGKLVENGASNGQAKVVLNQVESTIDEIPEGFDDFFENIDGHIRLSARSLPGQIENVDAITRILDKFQKCDEAFKWSDDTLIALDKIVGKSKYGPGTKVFEDFSKVAENSHRINGMDKFISKWGNSLDTGAKGIGGYEAELYKISTKIDTIGIDDTLEIGTYHKSWKFTNGEWRPVDVECDILHRVNGQHLPEFNEVKNCRYLTLTEEVTIQIEKQAWLLDNGKVSSVTWHIGGSISKPAMEKILSHGFNVKFFDLSTR